MRLITAVFCIIPACAFAQQDNTFIRGLELGRQQAHERQLQRERLAAEAELQKQRIAAEAELEKQRLALEREKLDKTNGASTGVGAANAVAVASSAAPPVDAEMLAAINTLAERYPDLKSHLPEMARIERMYRTWEGLNKQMYIEGFYWVAKSASFSTMATRGGVPAGTPIANDDVIALVSAGLQEATIIAKIQSSPRNFQLATPDLLRLKSANVPDAIMRAMLEAAKP